MYTLFLISIIDSNPSPTVVQFSTWVVALILEIILFGASLAIYSDDHREPKEGDPNGGRMRKGVTNWEAIEISIDAARIFLLFALVSFYFLFFALQYIHQQRKDDDESSNSTESQPLLNGNSVENETANGAANGHAYGTTPQNGTSPQNTTNQNGAISKEAPKEEQSAWARPDKVPNRSWWDYVRGYSFFFPYLWPSKSVRLQATVVVCFILLMAARAINVLVPYQLSVIVNDLSGENGYEPRVPWGGICLYLLYRLLQGTGGILGAIRGALWIPISQYSYQELSTAAFEHVHGLSLDFHLGKKTGEVLSALSKGNSINQFLEQITFQVLPMLIDLGIAFGYFLVAFDSYYALVIAIVTFLYLYLTIRLAHWRAEIRREMVNYSRQEDAVK